MPTLNVSVVDKIATGDGQIIVCDNTDYTVKFNLDAEWGEYNAKTMRVIYPDNNYEDTLFTGDECPLPRLYNVNSIRIGIYAGDLHATAVAVFECRKSVLSEEGQHVQPPEDIYNQIMDAIENGALDGVGIDHIDKTATAGLVDTYTIYYTNETTSTFEVTNGSSIASVAKTSTSGNVDTYTITMTDGTTSTFTVTNGAVTSVDGLTGDVVLDHKANIDGSYDGMTVGSAQQLLASSGVEDKTPYSYRTSGGSVDIGDREELNEINGMTVVWNQLVQNGDFSDGTSGWTSRQTGALSVSNNIATMNIKVASTNNQLYRDCPCIAGHKYLVCVDVWKSEDANFLAIQAGLFYGTTYVTALAAYISTTRTTYSGIITPNTDITRFCVRTAGSSIDIGGSMYVANAQLFDLTAMFGATIADYVYSLEQAQTGAGVAWFRDLFPNNYYAYSAPTLMSVKTSGHKTVGFNLFDKAVSVTNEYISASTGQIRAGTNCWRSDYIRVLPNTQYQLTGASTTNNTYVSYFDANKRYIGRTVSNPVAQIMMTTEAGSYYAIISSLTTTSQSYTDTRDTVCMHLVWSGTRNGEYEAYVEHTYPLDSNLELRGIPKLDSNNKLYADGDVYAPSGDVIRKYGIVDLGSLTWVLTADSGHNRFHSNSLHALVKFATDNIICPKYPLSSTHSASFVADKVIATSGSTQDSGRLWIWDDGYSTEAAFTTAMNGVYLVYELATSTTETADPYQQTQVVNDWGTEEFIDSRDVAIPVGHKTTYLPNLRDKLQHLPSLASDDGYYLINQQNNTMSLELFRIPKAPSDDGTYQLKATVTGGTPTYFWEAIV